jgi:hypothetical protein
MQDDLVDVAMTFRWLRGPTEIEARWPRLMAGLRSVADGVQAEHPTRRRWLGLDVAIDWCHQGILGLPLSEDAWAEAEGLIGRIKAMVGPDQVKNQLVTRMELQDRGHRRPAGPPRSRADRHGVGQRPS